MRIKDIMNKRLLSNMFLTGIIGACGVVGIDAQASGGTNTPNKADTGHRADANIRSAARVNPSTLAMEFSIPLGTYPGRAGSSVPVNISYSSKVWEIHPQWTWFYFPSPVSSIRKYVTDNELIFAKQTAAGWTSSLMSPRLETQVQLYDQYGKQYDEEFDLAGLNSLYQSMAEASQNPSEFFNMRSPFICGQRCTGGWTGVCVDGQCEWECQGWSNIYCAYQPPSPPPTHPPVSIPITMRYVKRVRVQMPDGSLHEFRESDAVYGFCLPGHPNNGPCEPGEYGEDKEGEYVAVDGSGLRLSRSEEESVLYLPDGGRYIFPALSLYNDEQWYATEYVSSDGNKLTFTPSETSNGPSSWKDTMGRDIGVPLPLNWGQQGQLAGDVSYDLPAVGTGERQATFKWRLLKGSSSADSALEDPNQELSYGTSKFCNGGSSIILPREGELFGYLFAGTGPGSRLCNSYYDNNGSFEPALFNPTVLTAVVLPNGKSYKFRYNRFGEIVRIEYPEGSFEQFVYDKVVPVSGANSAFHDQVNRGVKERFVYDAGGVLQQRWRYSESVNGNQYPIPNEATYKVTTIAPEANNPMGDGAKTERYLIKVPSPQPHSQFGNFGFQDPRGGMPYDERSFDENGQLRSRTLTEWIVAPPRDGGNALGTRDPRVSRSLTIMVENGQALVRLNENEYETPGENGSSAPTDATYFAHLNVKRAVSHHYRSISIELAETGTFEQITGYFNSSTVAAVSETDYLYDANYKARGISSLPIESRTLNPADSSVLAKTQTKYDNLVPNISTGYPGGYTTETYGISGYYDCGMVAPNKCWVDPNTPYLGRPTTSRLWDSDNNVWIETHTRYDIFGNAIAERNPIGNEATTLFENSPSKPYKYAYPTRTDTSAPDPTNTHGTNEGSFSTSTYDFMTGLPLTSTNEFGQTTATEYNDPLLRPTRAFAANFTAPETQTIYDDNNLTVTVRKQIDASNWDEATTYMDSLGRTIKTRAKDSQGDVFVETKYDFLGRPHMVTNPYRQGDTVLWSLTEYDEMGRAKQSREPVANQNPASPTGNILGVTSYDISTAAGFLGLAVTSTDAAGKKGRSVTNALGQLILVEEPDHQGNLNPLPQSTPNPQPTPTPTPGGGGGPGPMPQCVIPANCPEHLVPGEYGSYATYYKYNATGKMVEVTQGIQKRWFKYDSLGRLIRVRQPEQEINTALNLSDPFNTSGEWTAGFTYDVLGNVLTATDANGVTITNTYDRAGRVKTRSYSGEPQGQTTPAVSFYYDGKGLAQQQSPNFAKGKLTRVTSSVSETQYKLFDNMGRLTESSQITDGQTYTSKYTYTLSGALVEEEYPSGRKVRNEFETDGDLLSVTSKKAGGSVFAPYVSNFSYTASGGISQMKLGNGKWETAKFNNRMQVTELGLGNSATDASVWKTAYEYGELQSNGTVDSAKNTGNIAKQTLTVPGTSFVQSYKYDSLYRLTEAVEKTGTTTNWSQAFNYDRYGNRTGINQAIGSLTLNTTPTVNENTNRFNSNQGFGYDKNGNVISDIDPLSTLPRSFVFNGDNKQAEVKRDGVTIGRYYYDGEGKRVKKVTDTETTVFVYSAGKLIAEYSTQISQNPQTKYLTEDHLGTPRIITNELGEVVARRDFMPFGEELFNGIGARSTNLQYGTNADDVKQKFTGYLKDNETGLDFAEARMYENRYARYTAIDPLLASGKSANPQTFNRYVYVGNNPLFFVDRNGLIWGKAEDGRVRWFAKKLGAGFSEFRPENWQYVGKDNRITQLDPNSSKWRHIDPVRVVAESNPAQDLVIGFKRGYDDSLSGAAKGAKNFGINSVNLLTDTATGGQYRDLFGYKNPFEIERYSYNSLTEAKFGFGVEVGLPAGLSFGAGVFAAGSSSLSVVPSGSFRAASVLDDTATASLGVSSRSAASTASTNTGSYLHRFQSGKFYAGKGNEARMSRTGNFFSRKYDDPLVSSEFFPANSNRTAFLNEHKLMMENGGPLSVSPTSPTYNKILSPGCRFFCQ